MLHPLDLGATLGEGWQTFSKNAAALVIAALLLGIVVICTLCLAMGPMVIGYNRMCLRAARGEQVAIGDLFDGFKDFGPSFILMLIAGIATGIGFMFLVIPGIVLSFGFYWATWVMADGVKDPMECLRISWRYNTGNIGPALVFMIVNSIVSGAGGVVGGLGQLVTMPIAMAMAAHGYIRAFAPAAAMPVENAAY